MTSQRWLETVTNNRQILRNLIEQFHPIKLRSRDPLETMSVDITAPQAERACEIVRDQIRQESVSNYPEVLFDIAIQKGDTASIHSLLSSAWFGVPESTNCWQIPGFSTAVDLLDDPVEEPEFTENS